MGKKETPENVAPSAPPDHEQQGASEHVYPTINSSAETQSPTTPVLDSSSPPPHYGTNQTPAGGHAYTPQINAMGPQQADMPAPPSYDDAIRCPAALPPYLPYGAPKPPGMPGAEHGQPIYPPPISGTRYVLSAPGQSDFDTNTHGAPQPHIITTTVITQPGRNTCVHCYNGEVHNETDLICLVCLILFAIFTFPLGLILLCCIPCTVRRRCARCRRLN
ncbi:Brain protein I3 [Aphelenchoides fujianensis]|nr:Brain protein I3 [Aphelenchoides fujianensis]